MPPKVSVIGEFKKWTPLVHLCEFVRQPTVESIFQLRGALPNWFQLTHARRPHGSNASNARLTTSLMDNLDGSILPHVLY
jgi:hypothetical protein